MTGNQAEEPSTPSPHADQEASPPSVAGRLGVHAAVILSYVAIAFIHLRPLAFRFTETIPRGERMDALLHGWIINWTARQLLHAPWDLFQANLFFPHPDALAFTGHMVPEALPVVPIRALTNDPVITYNVAFMLTFVLGGWGTFLLVRRLTGNPWAAWVAGAFACYFPAKRWSLAHINTISVHGVPFALLALHRLLERPTLVRALAAGVLVALASLASAYYTVYLPLLLAAGVPMIWWAQRYPVDRRRVGFMAAAAVTAFAVALPLLTPYLQTYAGGDEPVRSYALQVAGAADVAEFFILDSLFWSRFLLPEALDPLTTPFFPGAVATFLLLIALFARRDRGRAAASNGSPPTETHGRRLDSRRQAGPPATAPSLPFVVVRVLGYATAASFVLVLGFHLVAYHRATAAFQQGPAAPLLWLAFLGGVAIALLVFAEGRAFPVPARALFRRFVATPRLVRAYTATTAFAMIIALGPRLKFFGYEGPTLPYHWIYYWMPGASALRAPYRAAILGQAFLAIIIGFGAAWLLSRRFSRPWIPVALASSMVVLMVAESTGNALPLHDLPEPASDVYEWLAEQPGDFGILEWPISRFMDNTAPGQWLSTLHWKRRVTGHNGRVPEDVRELHGLSMQWPPGPPFLDQLRDRFAVRYVIVHLDRFERSTQRQLVQEILPGISRWWELERQFGNDLVYRVRNGGAGRNLERRFAGWMVRGELVLRLAEPVPDEVGWRFGVEVAGEQLPPTDLVPGSTEIRITLPPGLDSAAPVWLRMSIEGPGGRTLEVERITIETPEGIVYP